MSVLVPGSHLTINSLLYETVSGGASGRAWAAPGRRGERAWWGVFSQKAVSGACGRAPKSSPGTPEEGSHFSFSGDIWKQKLRGYGRPPGGPSPEGLCVLGPAQPRAPLASNLLSRSPISAVAGGLPCPCPRMRSVSRDHREIRALTSGGSVGNEERPVCLVCLCPVR